MPDVTGTYAIRTVARMVHEEALPAPAQDDPLACEELEEVMDPHGATIAYFVHADTADLFCAFMNRAQG